MKPINLREADFKREVFQFTFPKEVLQEFFDYWTEPNPSNTKMRYELEKTWHIGRRVARWARNSKLEVMKNKAPQMQAKEPTNDFERLEVFLSRYLRHPTDIRFEDFGKWYEFMKEQKLMKEFSKGEVAQIKEMYGKDNMKCRSACVQLTLNQYANTGFRIADILKMRQL